MDWLNNFIIQYSISLVIPVAIIISFFIYAARRAQRKHIERIKKIDENYHVQSSSKASSHKQ